MEECAKRAAEKVPCKHAKIEDEELDMLAKVEAELEFKRIEFGLGKVWQNKAT